MNSRRHHVTVAVTLTLLTVASAAAGQTFTYLGANGPDNWSLLSPGWATCGTGELQSPVDLGRQRVWSKLDVQYGETTGEIFNNGHTIEVEVDGVNTLTLDGVEYGLTQFHFHTASEHRILGRGYDMELHLVHTSAEGRNAVVGVFLKRGPSSGALAPVLSAMPSDVGVKYPLDAPFNPASFLPESSAHYRYLGSLTTPPCTEGVQWVIMTEPVTVSDEDMAQFA
jgi:carbonic anhydrase